MPSEFSSSLTSEESDESNLTSQKSEPKEQNSLSQEAKHRGLILCENVYNELYQFSTVLSDDDYDQLRLMISPVMKQMQSLQEEFAERR
jgi:hypothetical protein